MYSTCRCIFWKKHRSHAALSSTIQWTVVQDIEIGNQWLFGCSCFLDVFGQYNVRLYIPRLSKRSGFSFSMLSYTGGYMVDSLLIAWGWILLPRESLCICKAQVMWCKIWQKETEFEVLFGIKLWNSCAFISKRKSYVHRKRRPLFTAG